MSILWETTDQGTPYSVRGHGATVRLYTNGVFHSQWNPDRPFAGGIWDCLSLPALYRPLSDTETILVLGVGGGAAIRQLQGLLPFKALTGVEIDPIHLQIARQWFGVDSTAVTLIEADAIAWVQSQAQGQLQGPFDLVIDDLFGHDAGEPLRAQPLTDAWVERLQELVTAAGLVVVNCVDGRELKIAGPVFADAGFRHAQRWSREGYTNAIGVFSREPLVPRQWSRQLDQLLLPAAVKRVARACRRRPLRLD